MRSDNPPHDPHHFPEDRRAALWIRPQLLGVIALLVLAAVAIAWVQYLRHGLPPITVAQGSHVARPGFPLWLRLAHYFNFLFLVLLVRSGLSILMDHPRLYRKVDCTPDTEWIRFTPVPVPKNRMWTANDDQRYISPWLALPGYRHTVGMARHWHFMTDLFWLLNGLTYVVLLFVTGHWLRLVPTSFHILPQAWAIFVHYATFHMPPEPDGFFSFNALQQLAYFAVVFLFAPLSIMTGIAMSPAFDNHLKWYPRMFGGKQSARSIHFMLMIAYTVFLAIHVSLVATTGFARNMNHIVFGTDNMSSSGIIVGSAGIAVVIAACFAAYWLSWHRSRQIQKLAGTVVGGLTNRLLDPLAPRAQYSRDERSPYFWPNGIIPTSTEWVALLDDQFASYRLRIHGLVAHPVDLSLADLRAMTEQKQTTLHHCIQGWSGIAQWEGVKLSDIIALVRPFDSVQTIVFRSYGANATGSQYYETQNMRDACHPQTILAYGMNDAPLGPVYGAPLRLRVENQLGYKMIKWIKEIEFVESEKNVGEGCGGIKEDEEFFDLTPNI